MKVLHVCESLIGGPASYLEEILPYQTQQFGADNVVVLAPANQRSAIASSINCVVETYERAGRDVRSILALALAIRAAIKLHDPDIVHLHSSFAGAVGRLIIRNSRSRARVVYCAHCWAFDRPRQTIATRLYAMLERKLSGRADAIVNISAHEGPLLRKAGIPLDNTRLVVSGMKDVASPPDTDALPATGPMRLLFVGRFDSQKGIDLLLQDFAHLEPGRATLDLVGAKIVDNRDLTIPPDVKLMGWVPRETLTTMFEKFDAVVMPSRWEGMPLLAIEVLRAGRPLLCSDHGAFPYFIESGVNGVLMDISTPGFLDRALTALENADRSAMNAAARETFVATFRGERMNRDLIGLYGSLVGKARQAKMAPAIHIDPKDLEQIAGRRAVEKAAQ
ncbi:MAG: glycosyltransferase family 4 protein [Xanthobacteraceae bacterium]|nr:glycosyltransferase family 4 protein [Hyphomicrobiales bacterium]